MSSIWDAPSLAGAPTFPVSPPVDVSGQPGGNRAMGKPGGAVMTSEGYGVEGGRPYGQQLQTERAAMADRWALDPAAGAKLHAATVAALGR